MHTTCCTWRQVVTVPVGTQPSTATGAPSQTSTMPCDMLTDASCVGPKRRIDLDHTVEIGVWTFNTHCRFCSACSTFDFDLLDLQSNLQLHAVIKK